MTAPTEDLTRIANNSRDAIAAAVNSWAEAAKRYATEFDVQNPVPAVAETQSAVDTAFDLASKLLAEQHALATTVVGATKQATDATAERFRALAVFPTSGA